MSGLMIGKSYSPEQKLSRAVIDIIGNERYTALAGILMIGKRELDPTVPTACTNGRDEKYGTAFVDRLPPPELRFVVLHESYHKMYRHLTTWRDLYKENAMLANIACDYVINLKILDDSAGGFAVMPKNEDGDPLGVVDERFRGMDAGQVYRILKREMQEQQPQDGNGEGKGNGKGKNRPGRGGDASGTGLDDHDWDGAQELSEAEKQTLARDIDEAIRQGALAASKMGTGGNRDLEALLQPKINWRDVLREFVTETCAGNDYSTWARPNRRYISAGVYMPSGISEKVGELVIAIDTSGSIGGPELRRFLSEVRGICETVKPSAIRLLYWDTQVCADETYSGEDVLRIAESTKPAGGGGTDVACVCAYMAEHAIKPQAAIILTDGYLGGGWGSWNVPTLWCIVQNKNTTSPVGRTVHVEDWE